MTAIILNGLDNQDDTINLVLSSNDTLISSTYGGNDYVGPFSGQCSVRLGTGNDTMTGGSAGTAYGEDGDDTMNIFPSAGLHNHYGGAGHDTLTVFAANGTVNA